MFDGGEVGKGRLITLRVAWSAVALVAVAAGIVFAMKCPYWDISLFEGLMMGLFATFAIVYGWFGFTLKK